MEKLIGVFTEVDGLETEKMGEMMDKLGIVGTISGNTDNIGLYCDNKGITYVIVHNIENHSNNIENKKYKFYNTNNNKFDENVDTITNKVISILFGKDKQNDTYLISDKTNGRISRIHIYRSNINTVPYNIKKNIIKAFGYEIYELVE